MHLQGFEHYLAFIMLTAESTDKGDPTMVMRREHCCALSSLEILIDARDAWKMEKNAFIQDPKKLVYYPISDGFELY